jgi:hypothetical protein
MSITSPSVRPSPIAWRVGIRDFTFEACSSFTHVTARRLLNRPRRPLSRGFDPASCPAKPLVSYQTYRQLSGWILPPLVIRAFSGTQAIRGKLPHSAPGVWDPSRKLVLVVYSCFS